MTRHLEVIGAMMLVIAAAHAFFPRLFDWRRELAQLSLINRQMMVVHSFFIALALVLMGLLCLTSGEELANTALGRKVALGLAIFWTVRLLIQLVGYSPRLWRGKPRETAAHVAFTIIWAYFSLVFWRIASGETA